MRKSPAADAPWVTLTGNQLGSLLVDFLLRTQQAAGTLTPRHFVKKGTGSEPADVNAARNGGGEVPVPLFQQAVTPKLFVVKTLVTTELMRRIADHYGVQTAGNLHVGFKWIGAEIDRRGPKEFVFGAEESYGFLAGDHVRDKDAAVASLLTAELAVQLKAEGKTLYQRLDELFRQYGCFSEGQINVQMPGEKGMEDMRALMARVRTAPPESLGGLKVLRVRDYLNGTEGTVPVGNAWTITPLDGPTGDLVILDLEAEGNYLAVRPSGTEPKVKIYLFAYDPAAALTDLDAVKAAQSARLKAIGADFRAFSGA